MCCRVPGSGKSGISCIPSARDRQPPDNKAKQSRELTVPRNTVPCSHALTRTDAGTQTHTRHADVNAQTWGGLPQTWNCTHKLCPSDHTRANAHRCRFAPVSYTETLPGFLLCWANVNRGLCQLWLLCCSLETSSYIYVSSMYGVRNSSPRPRCALFLVARRFCLQYSVFITSFFFAACVSSPLSIMM